MSTTHGARSWASRLRWTAFTLILALEVLAMGSAGLSKFQNADGWLLWFGRFGYPPRMAFVVGAVEMLGAGLLLLPGVAAYAALVLCVVMVGALEAVLTTETDLGWFDPVIHLAFLGIILRARWGRRWRPRRDRVDPLPRLR